MFTAVLIYLLGISIKLIFHKVTLFRKLLNNKRFRIVFITDTYNPSLD
jgi:hypothetical protein